MTSLYRKWRSQSFDDLVGQDHVVRTLRNSIRQGRVAHAYLFTGPRGTGKTSTARILAKAVNCRNPVDGNPCNVCEPCQAANEGRAMDVMEIDAASNTSVENVRDLRERVAYAAGEGGYKVYIVDEVHRLSAAAFDAFLKTLEEPPPHVIFVFASTEPHKVPETITSRCQRFDFKRIGAEETFARIRFVCDEEQIAATDEALRLITQHAGGSLRDALGLVDQSVAYSQGQLSAKEVRLALGLADSSLVGGLTDHLLIGEVGKGLVAFQTFVDEGGDPRQLTRQLVDYWRALLLEVTGAGGSSLTGDATLAEHLKRHSQQLTTANALAIVRAMSEQETGARFNLPPQLPFEMGYIQAALSLKTAPAAQPPKRVEVPVETPPKAPPIRPSTHAATTEPSVEAPPPPLAVENASPTPGVERGNGSTDVRVEEAWPEIVARMRAQSPMLQALLRSSHLLRSANGEITLGFLHDFHRDQVSDPKKRRLLEQVVEEVVGVPHKVTCVRTTKEEVEAVRGAGAVPEDDGFVQEVSERLREFHAKQLGGGPL